MPDILVFGCSYTQGFKAPHEESWSWQLSKRHPHLNFIDLSKGGSSVQFQYFLYNVVLQELNPDAVIFQLTTPFRISLWPEVFDWKKYTVKRSDNYTFFDNDLLEKDCVFASSAWLTTHGIFTGNRPKDLTNLPGIAPDYIEWVQSYFENVNSHQHKINFQPLADRINREVDLCFEHKDSVSGAEHQYNSADPIHCIETMFGDDFENYFADSTGHFTVEGCLRVADWIEKDFLKPRGLV